MFSSKDLDTFFKVGIKDGDPWKMQFQVQLHGVDSNNVVNISSFLKGVTLQNWHNCLGHNIHMDMIERMINDHSITCLKITASFKPRTSICATFVHGKIQHQKLLQVIHINMWTICYSSCVNLHVDFIMWTFVVQCML